MLFVNVHTAGHQVHLSHTAYASKILIFCHRNTTDVCRYNLVLPTGSAMNPNKHIHITQMLCFDDLECSDVELSRFRYLFNVCIQNLQNLPLKIRDVRSCDLPVVGVTDIVAPIAGLKGTRRSLTFVHRPNNDPRQSVECKG